MLLGATPILMPTVKAVPAAPAFWIVPDTETFYTSTAPVGTVFNVTIWVNTTDPGSFSWQVKLAFNATQLQAVEGSAHYTGVGKSQWVSSAGANGSIPVTPVFDNVGGSILIGESLLTSTDYISASSGSLFAVTFNITAAPSTGGTLSSLIDTGTYAPGDTFVLDSNLGTEPGFSYGHCTYSLVYASTTPPTIGTPTQVPLSNNVNASQSVTVSVNVTDNSGVGLKNVTLSYSTTNVPPFPNVAAMTLNATTGLWDYTIPGYPDGTTVYYYVTAYDNAGIFAVNNNSSLYFSYPVVPEFFSAVLLIVILVAMASAVVLMRKKINR
jgi:hypothetical protein